MNLSPGTRDVGAHIWPQDALWLPMDEEAWSKEVMAGSVGLRGVGAAVKVNKLLSWLQASPQISTTKQGCTCGYFQDHGNISKLLETHSWQVPLINQY